MASRNLGTLTLDLIAKTSSFEQGMDRASRRTRSTTSEFEKAAAAAQKLALAAGAAAAAFAASSAAIVMNAAKAMDATSKMAQQIGVTTEALTGMRFAAQQFSSISDQQFDQAMRRMTRRIEEAAAGSGAAKKALEEMGLSARELSRMTPDKQMLALADAMKRTESQANRLRYTMAIFDTEGMALVPALQQGAAAFEENIKLAERYGVVLSTEAAQAAEQFNTNLSHLTSMLDGLKMQLASEVLPTINQFISNALQAATEVDGLHSEVKGLANDSAFKEWFDASLIGLARVADVAVFVAKAVGTVGLAFQAAAADVQAGLAWIAKPNAADKLLMPAEDYNRLVAEYEAAMSRQETTVGRFNQTLDNLLTYQGNRFEQAAITAVNTVRVTSDQVKLVDLTTQGATKSTDANTAATKKNAAALNEAKRAAEAFRKEQERSLIAQYQSVSAIHKQAEGIEDQVLLFGLSKTALEDLTIARLEEQAAILRGFPGSDEQVAIIEREIEARKRLRTAMGSLEQKEAERASWEAWARDVETVFQQLGQSFTDYLFDGGKSARDMIRDLFKNMVLRVAIQPVMGAVQGFVTQQLGGMLGFQQPAGSNVMGIAQNASSLYSAASGGLTGNVSNAIGWLGEKIGSTALQTFASGMVGGLPTALGAGLGASLGTTIGTSAASMATTTFSASLGGAAAGGAAGGAAGLGAAFGAALPWIGGALAVGSMFGLFGDDTPKTRHGQRARVDFAGDIFDITSTDDRQPGAESSVQQMVKQAVQSANAVFQQAGIDAAIDTFYAMTESSVLGDRQGVASGGMLRIGDALRQIGIRDSSDMTFAGFGGWSEADMLPRLQTDIQLSILQAFQAVGDQLPRVLADMVAGVDIRGLGAEQAQALAQSFQLVIDQVSAFQVAVESLPFANLRDLSFDAAANLISFAGGLENLDAGMTSYFQNFYSEQEQLEWAAQQIGTAFTGLGLTMPDVYQGADAAKRQFRELVESLDLNTESGQQAYATLMTLSGGFAELVTGMESLNASVDTLSAATARFQGAAQAAQRAMQMVTSGGALADRIGGMLGLDPVFAMRREQELWATIGTASYEQQLEMAGELTDIVLNRINKEQQANQERLAGLKQEMTTLSRMRDLGASLQNYVRSLESSDLAPYSLKEKVGIAEGELANLVSAARRGDENAMRQVQGALQNALSLWREYGASGEEYQSAYHRLTGMVGNLANAAVSDAARQIAQLEAQSAALESMSGISAESLAQLQQLYDITTAATEAAYSQYQSELANANTELAQLERMGLDTARLHEIADLLKDMPALIGAQLAGASAAREQQYYQDKLAQLQATGSTAGGIDWMGASTSDLAAYFESVGITPGQHYNEYGKYEGLSYGGDTRDQRYYEAKLAQLQAANSMDGGIDWRSATIFDLAAFFRSLGLTPEEHYQRYGKYEGLSYAVGTSYVPHDMTANIHKGEIIIDPRSSDILRRYGIGVQSSGGDAAEMKALRQEVARLTQVVEQTGQAQVTATHQAAERSADKITAGVGQAVTRRNRDDLNARKFTRTGIGAFA